MSPTEPFNEKLMGKYNEELYNTGELGKLCSKGKLRSTAGSTSSITLLIMGKLNEQVVKISPDDLYQI